MRPGERDADDGDRQEDRGDEMAERQPPAGEHEPDQIAGKAEQSGADIGAAGILRARHRLPAEREERIGRHVERRPGPGQADDGDRHDDTGNDPGERHPEAAEDDPKDIQEQRDRTHRPYLGRCIHKGVWPLDVCDDFVALSHLCVGLKIFLGGQKFHLSSVGR